MKIFFEKKEFNPENNVFEITELKGMGHPDTISDCIGAKLGIEYSKYWMNKLGGELKDIPHYNLDKLLLTGGRTEKKWGGGTIIDPVKIIVSGNVTRKVGDYEINLNELSEKAINEVILNNVGKDFKFETITKYVNTGSQALVTNYDNEDTNILANDTSFGTGSYPLTKLENKIKKIHNYLLDLRNLKKWIGTDIKLMGRRVNETFNITIGLAVKDNQVNDSKDYLNKIKEIENNLKEKFEIQELTLNGADKKDAGNKEDNYYLTVTGSSAEHADPGQIGRGNRVNGLISPFRYQTLEATAGKNLTKHVGGFYNLWGQEISKKIYEKFNEKTQTVLVSEIGKPINDSMISVISENDLDKKECENIIEDVLSNHEKLVHKILDGKIKHYPFNYLKTSY